jgi:nitrate/TMAO reductase-like tetraheme cytochrome c subunit
VVYVSILDTSFIFADGKRRMQKVFIIIIITKGPITWRTFNPGVELSPVNRVEIFCDYMDDFNPGVETLYYTFSASIPRSKKTFILFS